MITYISTRSDKKFYTFSEVILKGIASDGGLFVPTEIPRITFAQLEPLLNKSYQEIALFIFDIFETDFSKSLLKRIINQSYASNFDTPKIAPLRHLKDDQYLLELWHGPTSAFKDMALQIMPHLFTEAIKIDNQKRKNRIEEPLKYLILVATSGDTGKAALEGYKDKEGISIIVFYPSGGVSRLQELSMTTQEGKNVGVFGMYGNFDDVQRSVKETFNDKAFNDKLLKEKNMVLSSANSINWGRLFPQIIYYFTSYLELVRKKEIKLGEKIDFAVPTGNFGNILSGYYAKMMGLPIHRLICASNVNNVLTEFLQTGLYDVRRKQLIKTPSPSMDILIASNLERLLYELIKDREKVCFLMNELKNKKYFQVGKKTILSLGDIFYSDWVSNEDCLETIKKTYDETNYLMDPHTAVAQAVVDRYQNKYGPDIPIVICSTAHFAKFAEDVYRSLFKEAKDHSLDDFKIFQRITRFDSHLSIPENILGLENKKIRHKKKCKARRKEVEEVILKYISTSSGPS